MVKYPADNIFRAIHRFCRKVSVRLLGTSRGAKPRLLEFLAVLSSLLPSSGGRRPPSLLSDSLPAAAAGPSSVVSQPHMCTKRETAAMYERTRPSRKNSHARARERTEQKEEGRREIRSISSPSTHSPALIRSTHGTAIGSNTPSSSARERKIRLCSLGQSSRTCDLSHLRGVWILVYTMCTAFVVFGALVSRLEKSK